MRITSAFWVAAYLRRLQILGIPVVLVRRGASEAGAIYIRLDIGRDAAAVLRPAAAGLEDASAGRQFAWALGPAPVTEAEAEAYLVRQLRYDEDLFIVAVDDAAGRHSLEEELRLEG